MDYKYDMVILGGIGIDTSICLHGKGIDFDVVVNFSTNIDKIGGAGGYGNGW